MNKHCYRIIFNKKRGMLMAVGENATSEKKSTAERSGKTALPTPNSVFATIKTLTFAIWAMLGILTFSLDAQAQIVADHTAPSNQQPVVVNAANGVPQVNIQTPSAAGVSRNTYSQFDVQQQGAILNNSRANVQTQLGGWVQANPYLAGGTARVILNEVNSSNPSFLRGYVEVAGDRAQVVIANPAGVTCDGCGFINANRATITTGTPIMSGGSLDGYRVVGGAIRITGNGLDVTQTDYTDLIARSVEVNAGIWANNLRVTAGANQVNADNTTATPIAGSGAAPVYGVDVAQLGGMFAGKITLVGTEAGVGVRNAGYMGASAGNVSITANGTIENTGTVYASSGTTSLSTAQNYAITNRGLIDGYETNINSGEIKNLGTGRIYGDYLSLAATTLTNEAENGVAPVIAARERLDIGVETLNNREHALILSNGDMYIGGALDASLAATGQATTINNDSASIEAAGDLWITAKQINNTNAHFSTEDVTTVTENITEYQRSGSPNRYLAGVDDAYVYFQPGDIYFLHTPEGNSDSWTTYNYTRTTTETRVKETDPGKILSGGDIIITADTVLNDKSQVIAGGTIYGAIGTLNNIGGSGERIITDSGTATSYWRVYHKGQDSTGSGASAYNPATTVQSISLQPSTYQENQQNSSASISVPNSSLYRPSLTGSYYVETDPQFVNYRTWLSSDYLFNALSVDPATVTKRLGDGFYEQKLIREQVAELTGKRFLEGYANEESQYMALMSNGVTFAQAQQLIPGIALTTEQVAALTSDIVWLVEKDVKLADGQTVKALVPQVYVAVKDGDVQTSGALIAANNVSLNLSNDLTNGGVIAGRNVVSLTAENIQNLGGTISGSDVGVQAVNDLNNKGGTITASNSMQLMAGHDVNIESTTSTQSTSQGERTNINRVAGLYVTGGEGKLEVYADNDVNLNAAAIVNSVFPTSSEEASTTGSTVIVANNNINLGTVKESDSNKIVWDAKNYRNDSSTTDVGTTIQAQGNVSLVAQNDINAKAANVNSEAGSIGLSAGNNVNLVEGQSTQNVDEAHFHKSKGFLSSKTAKTLDTYDGNESVSTTISGDAVIVQAGNDVNVKGSNVIATNNISVAAGNDVNVEAATNIVKETHLKEIKKSGLMSSGGVGFTVGSRLNSTDSQGVTKTAVASTVGSTDGNVAINADKNYKQVGSDVMTPNGSIDITAQKIVILEAREANTDITETLFKQSGLTVAVSSPVIAAIQAVDNLRKASKKTDDARMKGLAAASAALSVYNAAAETMTAVSQGDNSGGGIQISITVGSAKSESKTTQTSTAASGSTLAAGGDIRINASGAEEKSDVTIQGSEVTAGNDVTIEADNKINLLAANNSSSLERDSKSISGGVGVAISYSGGKGAIGFTANAAGSLGGAEGTEESWTQTHVTAGNKLSMTSGSDTNIIGATASGKQVVADVGGNLNIQSVQDTVTYKSKDMSLGGSVTVGYGFTGSVSGSYSSVKADYASVKEQSGIKAGDEGFQVAVKGNTDLKGAVIESTEKAVADGKNTLTTASITNSSIANHDKYEAQSLSFSMSGGGSGSAPAGSNITSFGNQKPGGGAGYSQDNGSQSSVTQSGVSGAQITITDEAKQQALTGQDAAATVASLNRDVSTDKDTSNALQKAWDANKLQEKVQAGAQIVQSFGQQASKAVGDYAGYKEDALIEQAENEKDLVKQQALYDEAEKWGEGGAYRVALHAAVGGLTGNVEGALGAGVSAYAVPKIAEDIKGMDIPDGLKQTLIAAAGTTIGATVGGASGATAAANQTINNFLTHDEEMKRYKAKKECSNDPGSAACGIAKQLDELDKKRDAEIQPLINACKASKSGADCDAVAQYYAEVNGYGYASMKFESVKRSGTPFSYNGCPSNDRGGCSYGPFQLAAEVGGVKDFLGYLKRNPNEEAQGFYLELQNAGGLDAARRGDAVFVSKFMELTQKDPQFVEYQFNSIVQSGNMRKVETALINLGINFQQLTTEEKDAIFSTMVQSGGGGAKKAIKTAVSDLGNDPEKAVIALYDWRIKVRPSEATSRYIPERDMLLKKLKEK